MTVGVPFDEMGLGAAAIRPIYRKIARWLEDTPPEILASRRAQANAVATSSRPAGKGCSGASR